MNLWTRRREDLGGGTTVVARLLERAQCGEHDEALRLAEAALKEPTGDLADGEAGMHFVRFVALVVQGRSSEAMGAIDLMLASADHEGSQVCSRPTGWPHHGSPPRRPGPRLQAMTRPWRRTSSPYNHCSGAR